MLQVTKTTLFLYFFVVLFFFSHTSMAFFPFSSSFFLCIFGKELYRMCRFELSPDGSHTMGNIQQSPSSFFVLLIFWQDPLPSLSFSFFFVFSLSRSCVGGCAEKRKRSFRCTISDGSLQAYASKLFCMHFQKN